MFDLVIETTDGEDVNLAAALNGIDSNATAGPAAEPGVEELMRAARHTTPYREVGTLGGTLVWTVSRPGDRSPDRFAGSC